MMDLHFSGGDNLGIKMREFTCYNPLKNTESVLILTCAIEAERTFLFIRVIWTESRYS